MNRLQLKLQRYARLTSLLSHAAGGALSPFWLKYPGAQLEHFSSRRPQRLQYFEMVQNGRFGAFIRLRTIDIGLPERLKILYMGLLEES